MDGGCCAASTELEVMRTTTKESGRLRDGSGIAVGDDPPADCECPPPTLEGFRECLKCAGRDPINAHGE